MIIFWALTAIISFVIMMSMFGLKAWELRTGKMSVTTLMADEYHHVAERLVGTSRYTMTLIKPQAMRHYGHWVLAHFFAFLRGISQKVYGYFHGKSNTYRAKVIDAIHNNTVDSKRGAVSFGLRRISLDE